MRQRNREKKRGGGGGGGAGDATRTIITPPTHPPTTTPDLAANPASIEYDGLFLSNGPGDPAMCTSTIASIQWAISRPPEEIKPVFGICLGNQACFRAASLRVLR